MWNGSPVSNIGLEGLSFWQVSSPSFRGQKWRSRFDAAPHSEYASAQSFGVGFKAQHAPGGLGKHPVFADPALRTPIPLKFLKNNDFRVPPRHIPA